MHACPSAAPNPPFGAVFTYYVRDEIQTIEEARREAEEAAREAGEPVDYPTFDAMRPEDREEEHDGAVMVTAIVPTVRTLTSVSAWVSAAGI